MHDGDWVRFDHVDFGDSVGAAEFHVSAPAGGRIKLRLDSADGEPVAVCPVPPSGERNQWLCPWQRLRCAMPRVRGVHALHVVLRGPEGVLMRLDTIQFFSSPEPPNGV